MTREEYEDEYYDNYDRYDKFPIIRYEREIDNKLYINFYSIHDI